MYYGPETLVDNAKNIRNCVITLKDYIENDDNYTLFNDTLGHDYFDTLTIKCNTRDIFNNLINEAKKRQLFLRTNPRECHISIS